MRLIDADKLIKAIKDDVEFSKEWCLKNDFTKGYCVGMRNAHRFVYNQPTVDAVKHGKWIHSSSTQYLTVSCSNCGYKVNHFLSTWQTARFCPHCGARMMEEGVE